MTKWVLLLLLALAAPATAQTFPKLTGRVVDEAHLLRPEQKLDIESKSAALEAQSGRQFVVATVPSLQGYSIEDYGYRLGRAWGVGQKGKNEGVILLVAPNEKKVRVEVGYGAGVFLTDAMSGEIIRNEIVPRFKAGDFGGGIAAGSDRIIKQMSLPPEEAKRQATAAEKQQKSRQFSGAGFLPVLVVMIIIFAVLASHARKAGGRRYSAGVPLSRRRRGGGGDINPWIVLWGLSELSRASRGGGGGGWGGGGGSSWGGGGDFGGGGGFSGGGGSFGGGGASGSW